MTSKREIVSELGGQDLLAPDRIARSLVANDQAKYYFALLQAARANADHPHVPVVNLRTERIACRLPDVWLDDVVGGTIKGRNGTYRVPHVPELVRRIQAAVEAMLECLPAGDRTGFDARLTKLASPALEHGSMAGEAIDAMTSGNRKSGDSLHLIVMDAHRAINKLQAATAVETLAGARVHNLSVNGRSRVEAAALIAVQGARTSHAAVVARQLGKVCVVGCAGLSIDASGQSAQAAGETLHEGDMVTVDGATGAIYRGELEVVHERPVALLQIVAGWRQSAATESGKHAARARKRT